MRIKYQSKNYSPEEVTARYVRRDFDGSYHFCEVGKDRRYDIRQGEVDASELSDDVKDAAEKIRNHNPSWVKW